jgi:Integrase core domain
LTALLRIVADIVCVSGASEPISEVLLRPEAARENYYLPGDLEAQIEAFVVDYNHLRYHESIGNLTPADVYFGRGQTILIERERIKRQTIANRRLMHRRQAA